MKLSVYAKQLGISYRGAYFMFKRNQIPNAYQLPSGTIIVSEKQKDKEEKIVIYARVSSLKQKDDLDRQVKRLSDYCSAKGWKIASIYKEIASGLNDNRPKLDAILDDLNITNVVIEHKDRLTRFGFNYIKKFLFNRNCIIEIINESVTDEDDLMQDFVSVVTSMCARLYGKRRNRRNTELLISKLKNEN